MSEKRKVALAVAAITLVGALLRAVQLDQSLVGDEMWSWTAATKPTFGGMLDFVRSPEEITPPLFTALAWLAGRIGESAQMLRMPSFLAGVATIPIVYGIGLRTAGRRAGILAASLAALSPFLIWFSIELRAYGLLIALTAGSTLALLTAIDRRRTVWWVTYAALSCAAMYTHYTAAYLLGAQLAWVLVFRPEARRPALIANVGAALAYLPWVPSLLDDLRAPSQGIIEALAPFGADTFTDYTTRAALGSPAVELGDLVGTAGVVLLVCGLAVAVAGVVARRRRGGPGSGPRREPDRLILLGMTAVAAPAGAALVSLLGDDQYVPRNLATSVPAILLLLAALLTAGTAATRLIASGLVIGVFAYGAVRTTEPGFQRTDWQAAADVIDAEAGPGDVVLELSGASPDRTAAGELSPPAYTLDRALDRPNTVVDGLDSASIDRAAREARGGRLFVVGDPAIVALVRARLGLPVQASEQWTFPGTTDLLLAVYEEPDR